MKKLFTSVFLAVAAVLLVPQSADARGCSSNHGYTYVSGYTSCGCPIYTKRVVRYYDCYGRPVYAYYSQPVTHNCRHNHYRAYRGNQCDDHNGYNRHHRRNHARRGHSSYQVSYGSNGVTASYYSDSRFRR